MKMNDFHYAAFLADHLYDTKMSDEDFEDTGLVAFKLINNDRTILVRKGIPIGRDGYAKLPCDCSEIEAVCYGFDDWEKDRTYDDDGL